MFEDTWEFDQSLNNWDVSSVTNMKDIFKDARSFDKNNALWYNFN